MRLPVLHVIACSCLGPTSSASLSGARLAGASIIRAQDGDDRSQLSVSQSSGGMAGTTTEASTSFEQVREIDPTGRCIIPMWNARDFVCEEHIDVAAANMFEDYRGRVRKKLEDGQVCTVQCPDPRWWQMPWDDAEIVCTRGVLKTNAGAVVRKIDCRTTSSFKFMVLLLILVVAAAPLFALRMSRKPASIPPPGPASQPIEIVDEHVSPEASGIPSRPET
mmetsp:Transcript_42866/g.79938  ORF Transcript_42866/g.79938 Transcript_42866/m.79938 type:complete len:221 (-) Transcript_42866:25-687(-)